jgi:hypothetical protein|nr:MAG TPA: hypothetical protein [Bacteriophage sp.]
MTKIKLGEKELNIKFGYEATLKSGIIAKIVQLDQIEDGVESVNAVLMLLPELILVGVQKFHEKEFGYDPNNEEQKEKQMKKVFSMLDDYFDQEDADGNMLYESLLTEMLANGFLSKMLNQERKKVTKRK